MSLRAFDFISGFVTGLLALIFLSFLRHAYILYLYRRR